MFGSLYSKALELFGKAFLISAFVPTLVVFILLALSLEPTSSINTLSSWSGEKLTAQTAHAVLLLIALYLFAFVIYGLRDQITRLIASGRFWVVKEIREARRRHFIDVMREGDRQEAMNLALAQASVWAEYGFGVVDKADVYIPKGANPRLLRRRTERLLKKIERAIHSGKLSAELTTRWLDPLSELFIALHQHAVLGDAAVHNTLVARLQGLCTTAAPPIDIKTWSTFLQTLTYGELADSFAQRLWSPPLRHVQPTALGNVLVWPSTYAVERYGIEMEFIYPRLLKVIDKEYEQKIADKQQFLDFTIALTFLGWVAAFLCLLVKLGDFAVAIERAWPIAGARAQWSGFSIALNGVIGHWPSAIVAILIIGAWMAFGWMAYRVSLSAAWNTLAVLTSAVDLYRLKLFEHLGIAKPENDAEEIAAWKRLNLSIATGKPPVPPVQQQPPASPVASRARPAKVVVVTGIIASAAALIGHEIGRRKKW